MDFTMYSKLIDMQVMTDKCDFCKHYDAVLCPTGLYIEYHEGKPFGWSMTIDEVTVSGRTIEELYNYIKQIKIDLTKVESNKKVCLVCYVYRVKEVKAFFEGRITAGDPKGQFEVVIDDTICLRGCDAISPITCIEELGEDFLKTDEKEPSKLLAMFAKVAFETFLVDEGQTHKIFKTSASKAKYQIRQKVPTSHKTWLDSMIPTQEDYYFIRYNVFRASICMTGGDKERYNIVSYDQVSAHAHKLITKDFPTTKPMRIKVPSIDKINEYLETKWCWFEVELEGVAQFEGFDHLDPFKVRGRKTFTLKCDQLQWKAFNMYYAYEKATFKTFIIADKGKLPKWLRCAIADLYMDKANHPTKDAVRNMLKVILNSGSYGIYVEKLYDYWADKEEKTPKHFSSSKWQSAWKNRLVPPQIGVSITSYVYLDELSIIAKDPRAFVYCDTDSIKFERKSIAIMEAINNRNEESYAEVKAFCDQFGYDYELMKTLGSYELDAEYAIVKAILPKEYIYMKKDGKLGATTAGYASHYEAKPEWNCESKRIPVALYEPLSHGTDPFDYFIAGRQYVDYKDLWCSKDMVMTKGWFRLTVDENAKVVAKLERLYKK